MELYYHQERPVTPDQLVGLFQALDWESAKYPQRLQGIIDNCIILGAWEGTHLIGLMSGLSDSLNIYFQYLCVHPEHQKKGVGSAMEKKMLTDHQDHLRQSLTAVPEAVGFYQKCGFHIRAGKISMAAQDL